MEWLWILWGILFVITACVTFLLSAIDVIEPEEALALTICIIIFPLGIIVLTWVFLHKNKDKIRKFLKIKD